MTTLLIYLVGANLTFIAIIIACLIYYRDLPDNLWTYALMGSLIWPALVPVNIVLLVPIMLYKLWKRI